MYFTIKIHQIRPKIIIYLNVSTEFLVEVETSKYVIILVVFY